MPKDKLFQRSRQILSRRLPAPSLYPGWLRHGIWARQVFGTGILKIIFLLLGVAAGIIEVIRELNQDDAAN